MSLLKSEPAAITFDAVKPGTLFVITFSVRNLSTVAQRIRLSAPKTGIFALNYIPSGAIAPGLDLRAEVECQIHADLIQDFIFTDRIVATMGNERLEIPITAIKTHAQITFDKSLKFDNVLLKQSVTKNIVLTNTSEFPGTMKVMSAKGSQFKLSTNKLDFAPAGQTGSIQRLTVSVTGAEVGPIREIIRLQSIGSVEEKHVDVSATIVEQTLTLLSANQQGALETVQFDSIYFGESNTVTALMLNSGPIPLSFSLKYDDDDEDGSNPQSQETTGGDPYSRMMTVSPPDGIVKAFSQLEVTFTFAPQLIVPGKGFLQQHLKDYEEAKSITRSFRFECTESAQIIPVTMIAKAFIPAMTISHSILRFGDCPVNDRRDIILTLSNACEHLPINFEFPIVATFKFHPVKGRIMPHENVSIIASFLPPQLGIFKASIALDVGNGLKTYSLKVMGEASALGNKKILIMGTDKLPIDFQPQHKFVDPEEEAQARLEKRKEAEKKALTVENTLRTMLLPSTTSGAHGSRGGGMVHLAQPQDAPKLSDLENVVLPPIIQASGESDEIYGTNQQRTDAMKIIKKDPTQQYLEDSYRYQQQHNQYYSDYLQQSHFTREVKQLARIKAKQLAHGAIDFSDPYGVNMGMDRGLDEPVMKLPIADEPLFMTGAQRSASSGPGAAVNANNRKVNFGDENRLIQKKFPMTPSTQAELRDCSKELTTDDLKLIQSSHKTIDFGRVNVGSVSFKSLAVMNNLHHAILVKIEDLDIELQQSRATTQVIPSDCTAGFDICFTSRVVGTIKKTFTWRINNLHTYKVTILAEVIPIEVFLSKQQLIMEFPTDSIKPTLTTEIIISNPGNATADFLWGSAGAFTCDPEKGSIAAGKSSVISITWDPLSGKRNEEELGLHVTGGTDQVLVVKGILKEVKGEFTDKRLNLGIMAVGTEKEYTTTIHNSGANELVYFLQPVDESLGLKMEPISGFILPNEHQEIKIIINPRYARSYDNISIQAKIRGGVKAISFRLSGSSIIPQVDVTPSGGDGNSGAFTFGSVTVGSFIKLPFQLRNRSPITATLLLDLSSYEDFVPNMINVLDTPDLATQESGLVMPLQEDEFGNSFTLVTATNNNNRDKSKASSPKKSKKKKNDNLWKIILTANSFIDAELIFRPTIVKKYAYKMPINLVGMIEDRSLQRDITAVAIQSVLRITQPIVDFHDRVVSRDPLSRVSYFLETTIVNQSNTGVSFVIREGNETARNFDGSIVDASSVSAASITEHKDGDETAEKVQIFFVSPLTLDLAPGASTKIRVTFQPQSNVMYVKKLGLFRKDSSAITPAAALTSKGSSASLNSPEERPYLTILCVGSGVFPCMSFSDTQVRLPTVPHNVTSRVAFTIFNNGYAALDVKHRISPTISIPLDISYPDGNQLGIMIDKIRVIVSVKSSVSTSFSGKVEFYDTDGERFFINLSGCIDNCLLTNYPFVHEYSQAEYGFIGVDDAPVQFLPTREISELRLQESRRKEEQRRQRSLERQRLVEGSNVIKNESESAANNKRSVKIADNNNSSISPPSSPKRSKSVLSRKNSSMNKSIFSDDTPINTPEGVDLEKPSNNNNTFTQIEELEFQFLLNWLNKCVCYRRRFDLEKYPLCVVDNQGDIIVDCFELMSGKKIPNLVNKDANANNATNSRTNRNKINTPDENTAKRSALPSEKGKLLAHAEKLLFKLQSIVNFLLAHGALLAHIPVVSLLPLNEYLLMQEVDFCKDKSIRITPSMLAQNREKWHDNWSVTFQSSWLEVMLQAVKIFVLVRLNYKDYSTLPGVVLSALTRQQQQQPPHVNDKKKGGDKLSSENTKDGGKIKQKGGKGGGDKATHEKKKVAIPKDLQPSNVFTHSEAVLLAWLSYHIEHAENACVDSATRNDNNHFENKNETAAMMSLLQPLKNKRILDLDVTFRHDFLPYCRLLHSHVPEIASDGEPLRGYTIIEQRSATRQDELFAMFTEACNHYHCHLDQPAEAICASSRTILLTLLHLYLTLPSLIPKTKVEFTGILGEPITKKIELRNPAFSMSKKPLCYSVSLRGEKDDFSLEKTRLLVESESEFFVTLNARFQHEQHCKIYFWGMKESSFAPAQTLCFELVTHIIGVKAVETIDRDNCFLYELQTFSLPLKNIFPQDVNCKVKLDVKYCGKSIDEIIKGMKLPQPPPQQRSGKSGKQEEKYELLTPPPTVSATDGGGNEGKVVQGGGDDNELESMLKQPFWVVEDMITLPSSTSSTSAGGSNKSGRLFNVHFLPFLLGKYICTISFFDANVGEFCYRIVTNVTLPKANEKLEISVQQGNSSLLGVTCNSKNVSYDKACTVLTEMRIKNANKKIRAKSVFTSFAATKVDVSSANGCGVFGVDFTTNFFQTKKVLSFVSDYLVTPTTVASNGNNVNNNNAIGSFNSAGGGAKNKKVAKSQLELLPTPSEFGVGGEDITRGNPNAEFENSNNKLSLLFNPSRAGTYRTTMVLFPMDNSKADIRCLDITCTAKVPDAKMIIEFSSPARQVLTQDIPITNETDEDWFLSLSTTGKGFSLVTPTPGAAAAAAAAATTGGGGDNKTLPVPAKNMAIIKVEFFASHAGNYDGKLLVRNLKDSFEYSLSGVAEEPLAEESLLYTCTARKKSTFTITLPTLNSLFRHATKKSSMFVVETDLPYVSCEDKIELLASEKVNFTFTVTCPVSGPLMGYLAFKEVTNDHHDSDGQQVMFWYSIEINVHPAEEERVIAVTTLTRSAVAVDITLVNPLDEPLLFFVSMAGEGLLGAKEFLLPAKSNTTEENCTYELIYAPLLAGDFIGRITFSNTLVGELWYKLELHAQPAPAIVLPTVEAMLGDETVVNTAVIENPTNETVTYTASLSTGDHGFIFSPLTGNKVVIGPYSESRCLLLFRPNSLGENTSFAMLTVTHPKLGEMRFEIRGVGLLPGVMKPVVIDAPLEEISSQSIVFCNPFPRPLAIDISLDTTNLPADDVFSLVVRRQPANGNNNAGISVTVAANGTYPIPVAFRPPVMGVFEARLNVRSLGGSSGGNGRERERELLWCYPLQGTAEVGQVHRLPTIIAPAKTSVLREALIPLTGLTNANVKITDFVVTLDMEETVKKLVQRSFQLQLLEIIQQPQPSQNLAIRCRMIFEPLRVFSSLVNIALTHRTKGKWRAKIDLDAQDPYSPDDTIKLAASVGETDRVTFKLSNRFLGFSPFQAFFTSNSSPHFTIEPQSGVLPPYGGEMANSEKVAFTVTFAPKEYGYIEQGTLNILTEDAQWTYSIKGSYPEHGIGSSNRVKK